MERSTRQRSAIRTVIDVAGRPLSPQEVLDAAQGEVPGLSLATVYRNLKQLLEAGEIQAVSLPGDSPRYESAHHDHHHHFQCDECGRVFDIHACPGDMAQLAPKGFTVASHELTLYGRCADCGAARKAAPKRVAAKAVPAASGAVKPAAKAAADKAATRQAAAARPGATGKRGVKARA